MSAIGNPAIANVFFRSGEHRARQRRGSLPQAARRARRAQRARQIETWGRGIQRIFTACKDAGTPRPALTFDGTGLALEFRYAPKYLKAMAAADPVTAPVAGEVTGQVARQVTGQVTPQVTTQAKALSSELLSQIAEALGIPTAQAGKVLHASDTDTGQTRDELQAAVDITHREHFRNAYRNAFLKLTRNLAPTGKSFTELEIRSTSQPARGSVVFVPESRKAINDTIKKHTLPHPTDGEGEEVRLEGILRAVHLDQDWLEVTVVDRDEQHVRVEKAGDAIDDVVGPMINRRVTVDAVRAPNGKHVFKDIQAVE